MLVKIGAIVGGSVLLALGINGFLVPYQLLDGGMIGVGLILHYIWDVPVGLVMIICSFPLYVLAFFLYRPLFYNSIHGILFSSFMIDVSLPLHNWIPLPMLASSIVGGLLVGAGIGLMLINDTTTGGSDLAAHCISRWTNWNTGFIILAIDGIVLLLGSEVISTLALIHSLVAVTAVGFSTSVIVQLGKSYSS